MQLHIMNYLTMRTQHHSCQGHISTPHLVLMVLSNIAQILSMPTCVQYQRTVVVVVVAAVVVAVESLLSQVVYSAPIPAQGRVCVGRFQGGLLCHTERFHPVPRCHQDLG